MVLTVLVTAIAAVLATPFYVVTSLAIFRVLKLVEYDKVWFAWIPIINTYSLIDAFKCVIQGFPLLNYQVDIKTFKILWGIGTFLPIFGISTSHSIFAFILFIIKILIMSSLYTYIYATMEYTSLNNQKVLGLISGIIPVIAIVKFFLYNKKNLNLENNEILNRVILYNRADSSNNKNI